MIVFDGSCVKGIQTLPHDEILQLIRKAKSGDDEAIATLVERNIPLVKATIKKYIKGAYEFDDVFQAGCIGLIKAIQNFNENYKVRFSTYAVLAIISEITHYRRGNTTIKIRREVISLAFNALKAKRELECILINNPSIEDISSEIGASVEDIKIALDAIRPPKSIYENVYDGKTGCTIIENLHGTADTEFIDKIFINELLAQLEERERKIIIWRYFKDKTQLEISKALGCAQAHVSRLERKALNKMRVLAQ